MNISAILVVVVGFLYIQCARGVYFISVEICNGSEAGVAMGIVGGLMAPVIWAFMPGYGWLLIFGIAVLMI